MVVTFKTIRKLLNNYTKVSFTKCDLIFVPNLSIISVTLFDLNMRKISNVQPPKREFDITIEMCPKAEGTLNLDKVAMNDLAF